jgi:hypothetical protein
MGVAEVPYGNDKWGCLYVKIAVGMGSDRTIFIAVIDGVSINGRRK